MAKCKELKNIAIRIFKNQIPNPKDSNWNLEFYSFEFQLEVRT
jgi:hypothetical protein